MELDETEITKNPNFRVAHIAFQLTLPEYKSDDELKSNLLNIIRENDMAPFYEYTCRALDWSPNKSFLNEMKERNEQYVKECDEAIADAQRNSGATEIKEAMLNKAYYLINIGDKDGSVLALDDALAETVAVGYKIDNIFSRIRVGLFFNDHELIKTNLKIAFDLIEKSNDWHRKNKLKVYEAVYCMSIRDFQIATNNFLDTVSTFTCKDIIDCEEFISYTVYCSMLTLSRCEIRDKILKGSDVRQAIKSNPVLEDYICSLYECRYADFFKALAKMEQNLCINFFLHPHYRYYVREMKIKAFNQLLVSYKTLSLAYMAEQFGVSEEFIENELTRCIASGRTDAKIDKIAGIVFTNRGGNRNDQIMNIFKHGDALLNRVQNLTRIVDI